MHKKILQLCLSPDLGGLELYFFRLSQYLNSNNNIVLAINEDGKLKDKINETNDFISFSFKRKSTLKSIFNANKLAKIIDSEEIDLIHLHWTKDLPLVVLAKVLSKRKPKIVQTRHMAITRFKSDFYHRFLYKNIDLIIAVTKEVKIQLKKFIPNDIRPKLVSSYIGALSVDPIDNIKKEILKKKYNLKEEFTIGIIGRIEEAKGQYLLINAINILKNEGINIKALIVGHTMDYNYLNKLKSDIKIKKLEEHIIFTGFTDEVQNLMQVCDSIVLATKKETFGLVLIEAMQCEISVIASNTGGPLEIIVDNESGLLFESQNEINLAKKIKYLYENKHVKDNLALNGKIRANELFNDNKQFNEVSKILEDI